jgi:hypothetical protein
MLLVFYNAISHIGFVAMIASTSPFSSIENRIVAMLRYTEKLCYATPLPS